MWSRAGRLSPPPSIPSRCGRPWRPGGVEMVSAEITMLPDTTVDGPPEVMELIEALEEHDDVQNVYTNWNMAGTD